MQRHAQDAINLQGQLNTAHNLLNNANRQINNFFNDMANVRNECLRRAQLLTIAYNNEANERRRWWQIAQERQTNGQRMAFRKQNRINILVREKAVLQILARRRKAEETWQNLIGHGQNILNLQNNPPGNMATIQDVMHTISPALAQLPNYDGQEPPDVYYQKLRNINEMARPLAVAGFNAQLRSNVMRNKMTGRFAPVPANNPYNGNNVINNEPEFLNWLQGKYREIMVGTNRSAIFALVNEKFFESDTPDSYERRIKPLVQAMPDADALPYLFNHLPSDLEMRVRIANPATVNAFFTELRNIWHESAGKRIQAPTPTPVSFTTQPQKDDFKIRLARDLAYSGIVTDDATLENFIYEELQKRLGGKTAHDEIDRLKAEYYSTLYNLKKCQDHLELKEEALVAQDNRIILLEDTVEKLKSQILKISHFQNNSNKPSEEEHQENMALPDILRNVGTALDRVENYIDGVDTTFNPKNTLNGIRISLTTVRGHMQRHAQDAINLQGLLHIANGRINNLMNDLANTRNDVLQRTQLLTLAYNNEVNERHCWWQIARERQTNGQRIAFRKQNQINVLLQEKGVLQILVRRRKAEADLAEFNRAWVWEESEKPSIQQIPGPAQTLAIVPQKDDFKIRLARDLSYTGIATDDATLERFIYDDLQRRLGGKTAHVRKNPFTPRSTYATKKVV
ncbi:hypothetical protein RhiirC2_798285 [Rhizophagus irregularis]|uniref:Uncharacterized protein n=1 Tax=Rhizophagus irregularis TaxID=588596 RepID=A0A2N1M6N9_9GLOM|nr:hypothetical protein RhiirC2_798285 [Rhizophagus irregularis]